MSPHRRSSDWPRRAPARRIGRYRVAADWHEVWTDAYWTEYLGGLKGRVAAFVQRACARIPQQAFCFSAMHAQRLRELGLRGEPTVLRGEWAGLAGAPASRGRPSRWSSSPAG